MTDEMIPSQGGEPAPDANVTDPDKAGTQPDPSTGADDAGDGGKPDKDGFTRRIDELTGKYREQERLANARQFELERRNAEFQRVQQELEQLRQRPSQATGEDTAKTLADFGYDEAKYQEYLITNAQSQAQKQFESQQKQREQQERSQRAWNEYQKRAEAYAKESPGYTEAFQRLQGFFPAHVADGLAAVEDGPLLVEYLGNNLTDAMSLRNASPFEAGMRLGELRAKVVAEREKAKSAQKKDPPPPAPTLSGSADATKVSTTSPDSDRMTDEQWIEAERKRVARKAKRA